MDTCDVLVIGGGPAGSTCARQLRRGGLDVAVMDKAGFPRDKVCAGWITPGVVQLLQLDSADYAREHVMQPIGAFRTGMIDGRDVKTRYDDVISFGIRRCEFDHYLLQRSGARLHLEQSLNSMERVDGRWIVNQSISTPLIIGAGGHFCPVARFLGAKLGADVPTVAAKEIEFEMSDEQLGRCRVRPDTPELYFTQDLKGYGWCFRKGRYLNIGLGREDSHHLTGHVDAFCEFLKRRGRIPADMPDRFHGHAYSLYGHAPRKLVDDGVLLIGDAAGLAYPESGEGIRPAIESALLAATAILEAKGAQGTSGDYSVQQLDAYCSRLQARFGPATASGVSVPQPLKTFVASILLRSKWFSRHVVLDRWFLHSGQAAL